MARGPETRPRKRYRRSFPWLSEAARVEFEMRCLEMRLARDSHAIAGKLERQALEREKQWAEDLKFAPKSRIL